MTDKIRKEFESSVLRDWPQAQLRRCESVSSRAGQYADERIQHAWWGWQASRAAMVIELPSPAVAGGNCIRDHAIRDCLEAAGLKVKKQ